MDSSGPDMAVPARAEVYAVRHGLHIEERLGFGQDGTVRATSRATALKIHARRHTCHDERAACRRLGGHGVEQFADRWPTVELVLSELREYGIYLLDIHPGNITFVRQS